MILLTEHLGPQHIRNEFSCGNVLLDNYLKHQAGQDARRKLSACFVLCDANSSLLKGYYTLSNGSIPKDLMPEQFRNQFSGSYSTLPATLLGRLAIDKKFQGTGTGKILLIDALKRSYLISNDIGSIAVIVNPVDENAERFYDNFGFIQLPDSFKMLLPMKTIKQLFELKS
jgi:predicted GNAT family N-acyltransferase